MQSPATWYGMDASASLLCTCATWQKLSNTQQYHTARPDPGDGPQAERAEQQPCNDAASSTVERHDPASLAADELVPAKHPQLISDPAEQSPSASLDREACLAAADDSTSHKEACSAAAFEPLLQAPDGCDECPECIICWEAGANVVLQPCGHLCVCSGCVELLRGALCPMCRGEVLSKLTAEAVL